MGRNFETELIPSKLTPQDLYYTALNGNWNANKNHIFNESQYNHAIDIDSADYEKNVYLGRICVNNVSQVNTFINKILTYERADANIDYSYINNSLASVGYIEKKTNQLLYGYMSEIDKFYKKYPQINQWFLFDHFNCNCGNHDSNLTTSQGEELNRNAFLSCLQNGSNSGLNHFHIIYHLDHAVTTSMGTSSKDKGQSINNTDVDKLSNGKYYQIIFSESCEVATYTKDCIAEHFLNNANGGAIAFIGNADAGLFSEAGMYKNFINTLFSKSAKRYDLGYAYQCSPHYWHNCRLHLLGDPEMQVWTATPKDLDVSITPDRIVNGKNQITIKVNNLPTGQKARICLMKVEEGYAVNTVTGSESKTFTFTPRTAGALHVTVTAHNYRPYELIIPVEPIGAPSVHISNLTFYDGGTTNSIGDQNGQIDAGETIEMTV